ncbi:MAG: hypothetical protein AAFY41_03950, partial [Bacteroidota bacterium]
MTLKSIILILVFIVRFIGVFSQEKINQFSSENDTLWIKTKKMKGTGVFGFSGGYLEPQNITDLFDYHIEYPDSLINISRVRLPVDIDSKLDYLDIITAQLPSGVEVVLVDQNNNQSFRDDTIYFLKPVEWYSHINSIPITFLVSNGVDTIQSNSWIKIGNWNESIIYGRDEYLHASIIIDDKFFEIGIIDQTLSGSFTYGLNPEIALLSNEFGKKDSINIRDLIKKEEYLNLGGFYYKFDSINT